MEPLRAPVRAPEMWHVYGATLPAGSLRGAWYTVTVKPETPQEMPRMLGPSRIFETGITVGLPHLASFDHEPTEDEMEALRDIFDPDEPEHPESDPADPDG